jgi:hypothetical protein
MTEDKWVHPDPRRLAWLLTIVFTSLFAFLAATTVYATFYWPEHKILENTAGEWVGGSLLLSSIFAAPLVLSYLFDRRSAWLVGSAGIAVYRCGRQVRFLTWPEIVSVQILPFGITARTRSQPRFERLQWVRPHAAGWLRQLVEKQGIATSRTSMTS